MADSAYFSLALLPHGQGHELANAFFEVVKGRLGSFDDDALMLEKASGQYVDITKFHSLNHQASHFPARGPIPDTFLNFVTPP